MAALFTSGRIVDLILALMLVEGLALAAYHGLSGRGPAPLDVVANLGAGAALLLALRFALTGARWEVLAGTLAAAGVLHVADLARRFRGRRRG